MQQIYVNFTLTLKKIFFKYLTNLAIVQMPKHFSRLRVCLENLQPCIQEESYGLSKWHLIFSMRISSKYDEFKFIEFDEFKIKQIKFISFSHIFYRRGLLREMLAQLKKLPKSSWDLAKSPDALEKHLTEVVVRIKDIARLMKLFEPLLPTTIQ